MTTILLYILISSLVKINFYVIPSPDEFWSEEQVAEWRKDVAAIDRLNEEEEEEEETEPHVYSESELLDMNKDVSKLGW